MSLTINVDIDGVLGDFQIEMVRRMNHHTGYSLTPADWDNWDPSAKWDLGDGEWTALFQQAVNDRIFLNEPVIEGAHDGVWGLVVAGHRVRIVTSKILWDGAYTLKAERDTLFWLARNNFPHDIEVVFTGNAHHKTDFVADVVIDDQPHIGTWAQVDPTLNILFDQPWNRLTRYDGEDHPEITRAHNWQEVVIAIEQYTDRW